MRLKDACILVTGGTRGMGRRFEADLASLGARVGICGTARDNMQKVLSELEEAGARAWGSVADVSSEEQVERLFREFIEVHGRLDAVVNNAGVARDALLIRRQNGTLEKMPFDCWTNVIDVNLTGVFLCGREAALHMIQQGTGGVIVSISSVCRSGNVGQSNYSAAKAGLVAMTVVWSKELARHGIRAVSLAPGYVETEMTRSIRDDVRKRIEGVIPLGRMGLAEEISHALRFVLENDYVNGSVIEVDGGLRL